MYERQQLADTLHSRPIGKYGHLVDLKNDERVRIGWKQWITSMQLPEFGTLTLRAVHGKNCNDRKCNGIFPRGSINCRVPGVQKTERLVDTFRRLCTNSFVVEELGSRGGRRHFHYLADGSTADRYEERYCLPEMAGRVHDTHNTGWNAVGFWKQFGGTVDNTIVRSYSKAIDYVLKDVTEDSETRVWFG
jgi:hypothetical protein